MSKTNIMSDINHIATALFAKIGEADKNMLSHLMAVEVRVVEYIATSDNEIKEHISKVCNKERFEMRVLFALIMLMQLTILWAVWPKQDKTVGVNTDCPAHGWNLTEMVASVTDSIIRDMLSE